MSYGFSLYFKQVKSKEDAFDFAMKVMDNIKDNAQERIEKAKIYMPSYRTGQENKEADDFWLYQTFTNSFTYWDEYKLLGMFGVNIPNETKNMFDIEFYFQNSTDQNYEYSEWGTGIRYFNSVIEKVKKMSQKDLLDFFTEKWVKLYCDDEKEIQEMKENIESDSEYYYKSAIYNIIFEGLDLDTWMDDENKSGKFIRFNLCAINGGDTYFKLRTILKVVKKNNFI